MTKTLPISAAVIRTVRGMRQKQRMSASELARRMTEYGLPTTRITIAHCESGYTKSVSVDWVWAASHALNVPVKTLLFGPDCLVCDDSPPTGFTCNSCGMEKT